MNDQKEKMHTGELYFPSDEEISREQAQCLELLYEYNQTRPGQAERRRELLQKMFAQIGEGCYLEPPFHANFGGRHVHFGSHVYANFNFTCVDDTHIYVGDHTMFGPNVTLATAAHPIAPALREQGLQYNRPIRIGRNCWIGAGVIVLPGVCIGDHVVIGAGSIVTKDLPSNVVAAGNPCRILRSIQPEEADRFVSSQTQQQESGSSVSPQEQKADRFVSPQMQQESGNAVSPQEPKPDASALPEPQNTKPAVRIEHAALYVSDLERARQFFETYFQAHSGDRYHNPRTGFSSYFLTFSGEARLEIMNKPELVSSGSALARTGFIHLAFSLGSAERVDALTRRLRADGCTVISGPRTTGDGYYESCILDLEGNQIELTV